MLPRMFHVKYSLRLSLGSNACLPRTDTTNKPEGDLLDISWLKIMADSQDPSEVLSLLSTAGQTENPKEEESQSSLHCRVRVAGPTPCENGKKCYRGSTPDLLSSAPVQTVNKYNTQYHKLFQCLPKEEVLMKVYSCALLRDILLQGRLYISKNWLCFHANLFGKDIKVAIPVVSVLLVKKHKTAGLVPNGLAITTESSQKYLFVSLLSRDSVYDVLRRVCTHLQVNGKKILSIKQYTEEPSPLSLLLPHDEFPPPDEFPPVLKWRRKPSTASIASSLPDILGNSTSSLSAVDASFQSDSTTQDRSLETEKVVMVEPVPELGQMEYQLLKFFILLIILLICSSCYLAFRVSSLEHQLSFLNTNPLLPANER